MRHCAEVAQGRRDEHTFGAAQRQESWCWVATISSSPKKLRARQRASGGAGNPSDVDRKSVESGALPQTSANKCKRVNNSGTAYHLKGPNMVVSQGPGLVGPSRPIGPLAWNSVLAQTFPRPWAWSCPPSSLSRPAPASYAPFASCTILHPLLSCRSLLCLAAIVAEARRSTSYQPLYLLFAPSLQPAPLYSSCVGPFVSGAPHEKPTSRENHPTSQQSTPNSVT